MNDDGEIREEHGLGSQGDPTTSLRLLPQTSEEANKVLEVETFNIIFHTLQGFVKRNNWIFEVFFPKWLLHIHRPAHFCVGLINFSRSQPMGTPSFFFNVVSSFWNSHGQSMLANPF